MNSGPGCVWTTVSPPLGTITSARMTSGAGGMSCKGSLTNTSLASGVGACPSAGAKRISQMTAPAGPAVTRADSPSWMNVPAAVWSDCSIPPVSTCTVPSTAYRNAASCSTVTDTPGAISMAYATQAAPSAGTEARRSRAIARVIDWPPSAASPMESSAESGPGAPMSRVSLSAGAGAGSAACSSAAACSSTSGRAATAAGS